MDAAQQALFGEFPRAVGAPEQHMVHSASEFDAFVDTVEGKRNAYATISWFPPGDGVTCDKVSFDLDSAAKDEAFPGGMTDDAKITLMRKDDDVADEVLGDVCDDARKLGRAASTEGIPALGVFSGFGLHVHLLFQPESDPGEKMGTVARYWRERLDLITMDHAVVGDEQRILRVPNMRRVHHDTRSPPYGVAVPCDLWTVPLTRDELAEVTPQRLLELSRGKRPDVGVDAAERPAMPFYDDYTASDSRVVTSRPDRPSVEGELSDEGIEWYVKELLRMPCMYENLLLDPEPPHDIRVNAAVMLFNLGMGPSQVVDVFRQIGWRDWDESVTRSHVKHIYQKGYSDMNCTTMRRRGYCTREDDDPTECPCYGWRGGECEWKE